jgi:N-acetyl-gamma-glutamyl-phosphate reductase
MTKYKAAVVGAAGYTGIEIVRYLLAHPGFELVATTSDAYADVPLAQLYPALSGQTDLKFSRKSTLDDLEGLEAVFLAVPHTAAMALAPDLLERGISVFDLSADFRLHDAAVYEQWYQHAHTAPELLQSAVYGLPELYRTDLHDLVTQRTQEQKAALVACPGCYPTASALAAAPALAAGAAREGFPVIINALSGASGLGRKATEQSAYIAVNENARAYGVTTHRHTPEIEQTLSAEANTPVQVQFTPHLVPMKRGLLATVNLAVLPGLSTEVMEVIYNTAYADEAFVQMLPTGVMPQTASVVGTNQAQVGLAYDARLNQLIVSCAIDNLGKGASAQAVQCANIVFGFPETCGLTNNGAIV